MEKGKRASSFTVFANVGKLSGSRGLIIKGKEKESREDPMDRLSVAWPARDANAELRRKTTRCDVAIRTQMVCLRLFPLPPPFQSMLDEKGGRANKTTAGRVQSHYYHIFKIL